MPRYHSTIEAVRVGQIDVPETVERGKSVRRCQRCPKRLIGARNSTVHCSDCYRIVQFEENCARYGIDISALEDDQFVRFCRSAYRQRNKAEVYRVDENGKKIPGTTVIYWDAVEEAA